MKSLTHRQERFCHAFVHWANGAEAAREAGYTVRSARKQASVMLQTVRIRARIHEIQTQLAEDAGADMAALIGKLEIIYRRAIGDHHFYAAARAVELQVKLVRAANRPPALIEGDVLEELQKKVDDRVKDAASP
jgi:phage terminase small subunit